MFDTSIDNNRKLKLILKLRDRHPKINKNALIQSTLESGTYENRNNERLYTTNRSTQRRKIFVKDIVSESAAIFEESTQRKKARAQTALQRTSVEKLVEPKIKTVFNDVVTSVGSLQPVNVGASDRQSFFETRPARSKVLLRVVDNYSCSNKLLPYLEKRCGSKLNLISNKSHYTNSQTAIRYNHNYPKFVDVKKLVISHPVV